MELVTRSTPLGTPVGTANGKVVHLLWLRNGDAIWALCDRKVRGRQVIVRGADEVTCTDCEDERDYREAKAAGFEHQVNARYSRVSASVVAGSRATALNAEIFCRGCAEPGEPSVRVWKANGITGPVAEHYVRQHYITMWRAHKAAEREAARVAETADKNRSVTVYRRDLRDAFEELGDKLAGLSPEDQAAALYEVLRANDRTN